MENPTFLFIFFHHRTGQLNHRYISHRGAPHVIIDLYFRHSYLTSFSCCCDGHSSGHACSDPNHSHRYSSQVYEYYFHTLDHIHLFLRNNSWLSAPKRNQHVKLSVKKRFFRTHEPCRLADQDPSMVLGKNLLLNQLPELPLLRQHR